MIAESSALGAPPRRRRNANRRKVRTNEGPLRGDFLGKSGELKNSKGLGIALAESKGPLISVRFCLLLRVHRETLEWLNASQLNFNRSLALQTVSRAIWFKSDRGNNSIVCITSRTALREFLPSPDERGRRCFKENALHLARTKLLPATISVR